MSGNLWMFSDMLDDEDIEMLKRDFITYYQGADYYGLDLKVFTRMAHEAGAIYKIGKKVDCSRKRRQDRQIISVLFYIPPCGNFLGKKTRYALRTAF